MIVCTPQLHVTEYGVHWNFFFTLAAVALLSASVHALLAACFPDAIPGGAFCAAALLLAGGYQVLLRRGLQDVLLSDDRTSFLLQNKEGLAGLFGAYPAVLAVLPHACVVSNGCGPQGFWRYIWLASAAGALSMYVSHCKVHNLPLRVHHLLLLSLDAQPMPGGVSQ